MKKWKKLYKEDLLRYGNSKPEKTLKLFLKYLRKCQNPSNRISSFVNKVRFRRIKQKMHIEVYGRTQIGRGLYIGHPFGITINSEAIIGNNCNIHKGVTIGGENRGNRKGSPIIGSEVWIGINSTIVGGIHIGDDVLIAPNSFVNCDVPPHSVVVGNPCSIHKKLNATEDYINNKVNFK